MRPSILSQVKEEESIEKPLWRAQAQMKHHLDMLQKDIAKKREARAKWLDEHPMPSFLETSPLTTGHLPPSRC